jgi:hypothetical protein
VAGKRKDDAFISGPAVRCDPLPESLEDFIFAARRSRLKVANKSGGYR